MQSGNKLIFVIVGGVIGLLVLVLLITPSEPTSGPGSAYNTDNSGMAGALQWLEAIGYDAKTMEYRRWEFTEKEHAIIIAQPDGFTEADNDVMLEWVRETGATVIFLDNSAGNPLLRHLSMDVKKLTQVLSTKDRIPLRQPLGNPPVAHLDIVSTYDVFSTLRTDGVVLAGTDQEPIVVGFIEGKGMIYLVSAPVVFANHGLKQPNNGAILLNLLGRVPPGGTILLDEIHHGRRLNESPKKTINQPLIASLLYTLAIIGLWAYFNGKRFGAVVPIRQEVGRRSSAEYVQSMANLFQRGRQNAYMLKHYKTHFKRRVARPYGFNPLLSDHLFVQELARSAQFDQSYLSQLLGALGNPNPNEEALLTLVDQADRFVQELENGQ